MAGRGVRHRVAFALVSAPLGAAAGERAVTGGFTVGGFELAPLVAPRAPATRAAPAPAPRPVCVRLCDGYFFPLPATVRADRGRRRRGRLSRSVSLGERRALFPARPFRPDRGRRQCARRTLFRLARRLSLSLRRRARLRLPPRRRARARLLARPDAEERRRGDDRRRGRRLPRRRRRRALRRRSVRRRSIRRRSARRGGLSSAR